MSRGFSTIASGSSRVRVANTVGPLITIFLVYPTDWNLYGKIGLTTISLTTDITMGHLADQHIPMVTGSTKFLVTIPYQYLSAESDNVIERFNWLFRTILVKSKIDVIGDRRRW
jgi:hypothetical protein